MEICGVLEFKATYACGQYNFHARFLLKDGGTQTIDVAGPAEPHQLQEVVSDFLKAPLEDFEEWL